ncbi:hypothetical protein COU75_01860 [Candidatus Peregrinibacteria bacterium CG10_big_fil_rev_8_21_14_0_10_42_8]|nr:MAG: hypothetical protein COU75_01860 [Candidatus Peregrinibacteria bacterium CG10_big_fil_rev_8_21_14_0_10_42_8]
MSSRNIITKILSLELEEKILNGATVLAFICVFMPWVGGEWLGGKTVTFNGLGFFTSFIGLFILLVLVFILLITIIPITGGPKVIHPQYKNSVRLLLSVLATLFTIAIWSVLTKFTFEFSRLKIHFGLYGTLMGSLVASLYSFILMQEGKKNEVNRLFSHDDELQHSPHYQAPDQGVPEDHRKYR